MLTVNRRYKETSGKKGKRKMTKTRLEQFENKIAEFGKIYEAQNNREKTNTVYRINKLLISGRNIATKAHFHFPQCPGVEEWWQTMDDEMQRAMIIYFDAIILNYGDKLNIKSERVPYAIKRAQLLYR